MLQGYAVWPAGGLTLEQLMQMPGRMEDVAEGI